MKNGSGWEGQCAATNGTIRSRLTFLGTVAHAHTPTTSPRISCSKRPESCHELCQNCFSTYLINWDTPISSSGCSTVVTCAVPSLLPMADYNHISFKVVNTRGLIRLLAVRSNLLDQMELKVVLSLGVLSQYHEKLLFHFCATTKKSIDPKHLHV